MALSEREQQMLDQMEQALRAEDPRFASQMNGSSRLPEDRRRLLVGGLGALAGLGLVILGINTTMWIGVAGFVLIVAAVAFALAPRKGGGSDEGLAVVADDGSVQQPRRAKKPRRRPQGAARPQNRGSFMQRMEQRWDERRQGGQGRF